MKFTIICHLAALFVSDYKQDRAESKLAGPIKLCKTIAMYNVFSVVLVFSMLGLGRILISDLVVANLLMYSFPGMILLYLAATFFIP